MQSKPLRLIPGVKPLFLLDVPILNPSVQEIMAVFKKLFGEHSVKAQYFKPPQAFLLVQCDRAEEARQVGVLPFPGDVRIRILSRLPPAVVLLDIPSNVSSEHIRALWPQKVESVTIEGKF